MITPHQHMENALSRMWDKFESEFASPSALEKAGIERYSGGAGCGEWDGTGDFYGSSDIWLHRPDGLQFFWRVGVLFEQGDYEGEHWEQGGAYSYVSIGTTHDGLGQVYYNIGNIQLPSNRMTVEDLIPFSESIANLCDECFEDLAFVFRGGHFNALLELAREKRIINRQLEETAKKKGINITEICDLDELNGWKSNPLKE